MWGLMKNVIVHCIFALGVIKISLCHKQKYDGGMQKLQDASLFHWRMVMIVTDL